jgi:hypothetical protein
MGGKGLYGANDPYRGKTFDWEDISLDTLSMELEGSLLSARAFGKAKTSP